MSQDHKQAPAPQPGSKEAREMYSEIAALVGALAKAYGVKDAEVAAALEAGAMTLDFAQDGNGNRYVAATFGDKTARVYQGAIKREDGQTG